MDENQEGQQEQPVEHEQEPTAEAAVEAPALTYESILRGLLTDLDGMAHLAKSEVEAIVAAARAKFETL